MRFLKLLIFGFIMFFATQSQVVHGQAISLEATRFQTIDFENLPKTEYRFEDGVLYAKANQSASVLIYPFEKIRQLSTVKFEWFGEGSLAVRNAAHEASKSGDDAWLRVGLMIHGKAPTVPFFAPAWIKQTRDALKHPSDRMIYLVPGSQHSVGDTWSSRYSSGISSIAVLSTAHEEKPWLKVSHTFDSMQEVAGLWLMVDSDNTGGKIEVRLRNLELIE